MNSVNDETYLINEFNQYKDLIHFVLHKILFIKKGDKYYGVSYDDLYSEGKIGLISAIQTYDENLNIKKTTYYSRCIKNEVIRNIIQLGTNNVRRANIDAISLNNTIYYDEREEELLSMIGKDDHHYKDLKNSMFLDWLLNHPKISGKKKRLLDLYYIEGYKQKEIADMFKISHQAVSFLLKEAHKSLRKIWEENNGKKVVSNYNNKTINNKKLKKYKLYDIYLKNIIMNDTINNISIYLGTNEPEQKLRRYCYHKFALYGRYYILKENEMIEDINKIINERKQ